MTPHVDRENVDRDSRPALHPVILSGGSGTRLWPMSRAQYPKQLLPLLSERTLLQETALRVADGKQFAPPLIISNDEHRFIVAEQLRVAGVTPATIILEPLGRNTAPACCVAALSLAAAQLSYAKSRRAPPALAKRASTVTVSSRRSCGHGRIVGHRSQSSGRHGTPARLMRYYATPDAGSSCGRTFSDRR
jgi:nucleotidyltransferase-like protein